VHGRNTEYNNYDVQSLSPFS